MEYIVKEDFMHLFKLFSFFFSKAQSLKKAIKHALPNDTIHLKLKEYKESIHFDKNVTIVGNEDGGTIIEGIFIIPKSVSVTFRNLIILPTSQLYVEGDAHFEDCQLIGQKTDILITVNGGTLKVVRCQLSDSKEVAIAAMNKSNVIVEQCTFHHNRKVHLLVEKSTVIVDGGEFSHATHSFWLNNQSFLQSKNTKIHHHSGTQIIVEKSKFIDDQSTIEHGDGNGIFILSGSNVQLNRTTVTHHELAQLWIQQSDLIATHCQFQHGNDCGMMFQQSEVQLYNSTVSDHKKSNVFITKKSRIHLDDCRIFNGQEYGLQVHQESIVNLNNTILHNHREIQLFAKEKSILSMKNCLLKDGKQLGISLEKKSHCSIVESKISHHENTAININQSTLILLNSVLNENMGNGILAVNNAIVEVDSVQFLHHKMPHIACRLHVNLTLLQSQFTGGKSLYAIEHCDITANDCTFSNSENVQVEFAEMTTATLNRCTIENGKSYGIKVLKNSNLQFINSQLCNHGQAQMVVNDSSVVLNNSEIFKGKRSALLIQNHSEVNIIESFISNHLKPQIWIDFESTVELNSVQLTEGHHSDLLAQNQCAVYISDSIIRNEKFRYNVQAMNHSKIEIMKTIVENKFGDIYYSENNSVIQNVD